MVKFNRKRSSKKQPVKGKSNWCTKDKLKSYEPPIPLCEICGRRFTAYEVHDFETLCEECYVNEHSH